MAASLGQVDSELLETSIIISACERGDLSELQRVLEESQLDIGSEPLDSEGQTALHIACANGHLHIAQYLVNEKECSVMVEDVYGHNPFVLSLINKHWKVAEYLLIVSPSSDSFKKHIGLLHYGESLVAEVANEALTESCSSETCVQFALAYGYMDIAFCLKYGVGDVSPSHISSLLNKVWAIKEWQAASSLLKITKRRGFHESIGLSSTGLDQLIEVVPFETHAFNTACSKGYLEVARYLHEKDLCSPVLEAELVGTGTPLESARFKGHLHIVQFLLKYCNNIKPDDLPDAHVACIVGDEKKVTSSLASNGGTVLSTTDRYGMNALHYASCEPKLLSMLIREQQSVCTKEMIENIPLHYASLINTKDLILGNTPLHYAVLAGCTVSVHLLLRAPECDINLVNTKRETPLHLACKQSDIMILEMLATEEMCDLNVQNDNGDSALHIAVMGKMPAKYDKALAFQKRCNPSIVNHKGMSPLQLAFKTDQLSTAEVLLCSEKCSHEDIVKAIQCNPCLLHRAIHAGRKSLFTIEIKACNINEANHDGQTPVHVACTAKNNMYFEVLTQQPTCNLSIQDMYGDTALHIACSGVQSTEKVYHMLEHDRHDPNITNKQGYSPLHTATVKRSRFESVKMLLNSAKCNPNMQNLQGNTALHLSIHQKLSSVIEYFLMCDKVDVNIQNKKGNTPLHVAVIRKTSIFEHLISHPDINPSISNQYN